MKLEKTDRLMTCPDHGDTTVITVIISGKHGFQHSFDLCRRCVDNAMDAYMEDLVCAECGEPAEKDFGVEHHGQRTPLCRACQVERCLQPSTAPDLPPRISEE